MGDLVVEYSRSAAESLILIAPHMYEGMADIPTALDQSFAELAPLQVPQDAMKEMEIVWLGILATVAEISGV